MITKFLPIYTLIFVLLNGVQESNADVGEIGSIDNVLIISDPIVLPFNGTEKPIVLPINSTTTQKPTTASTTTTIKPKIEGWHCGSGVFFEAIAEHISDTNCPAGSSEANICCYHHDICYGERHGQELCDDAFCNCLNKHVSEQNNFTKGCKLVSDYFCNTVRDLGDAAYRASEPKPNVTDVTTKLTTTTETIIIETDPVDNSEEVDFQSETTQRINKWLSKFWTCKDYVGTHLNTCFTSHEDCITTDYLGVKDTICTIDFCGCAENIVKFKHNQIIRECLIELKNTCLPTIESYSETEVILDNYNISVMYDFIADYSNAIYGVIVFILALFYLYYKGYFRCNNNARYHIAPNDSSQSIILNDFNMAEDPFMTSQKLKTINGYGEIGNQSGKQ
uniref:Phospholipase A(2) n=1 Tax=Rhabditophanes sp. KR3021 TaxID=114890 RepID=A0AC35UBJ6_9BILA